MSEKDTLDKIVESEELTNYEKLCVLYLLEMHIDKITTTRKTRHDCVKEIAEKNGFDYHKGFGFFKVEEDWNAFKIYCRGKRVRNDFIYNN